MIALLALLSVADAGEWKPAPYARPILGINGVVVNGDFYAVASGGAEAGIRMKYQESPNWLNTSRVRGVGSYGLNSNSMGADIRVGNFIGPNQKYILTQHGPDVYFNGYGQTGAEDYHLPWSVGLDLRNLVIFKASKGLQLICEATPGLPFAPSRQGGVLDPFELTLAAAVAVRAPGFGITVGYQRRYTAAGILHGLILGASL